MMFFSFGEAWEQFYISFGEASEYLIFAFGVVIKPALFLVRHAEISFSFGEAC